MEVSLLLLVEVCGWAVVEGKWWVWVGFVGIGRWRDLRYSLVEVSFAGVSPGLWLRVGVGLGLGFRLKVALGSGWDWGLLMVWGGSDWIGVGREGGR